MAPPEQKRDAERTAYEVNKLAHPFTGIDLTQKGVEHLVEYVEQVRAAIGYEVPLAVDHLGHIGVEDAIRLARALEPYNLAWLDDASPWYYTDQYARLSRSTTAPIATGEDICLKENFRPLLEAHAVSVIHPDLLSAGGIYETKKVGDLAQDHGVAMAMHFGGSPMG